MIISELGRGGMATVYKANDPRFKRDVAIKVLPSQFMHDDTFRARFEREAQMIAALEHPAIVPVYDIGEEGDQPYLVMRYMPGGSLADRLKDGPMQLDRTVQIVSRLASALDQVHAHGIIHRDIKPANILFDQYDNAFLSDFGIARLAEANATLTGDNIIGTPAYMSPEQARGDPDIDGRSDIYALGAILYQMLTGRLPYEATTPMGIAMKQITDPVPNILEANTTLPPESDTVIRRAMAKERAQRFTSGTELANMLDTIVSKGLYSGKTAAVPYPPPVGTQSPPPASTTAPRPPSQPSMPRPGAASGAVPGAGAGAQPSGTVARPPSQPSMPRPGSASGAQSAGGAARSPSLPSMPRPQVSNSTVYTPPSQPSMPRPQVSGAGVYAPPSEPALKPRKGLPSIALGAGAAVVLVGLCLVVGVISLIFVSSGGGLFGGSATSTLPVIAEVSNTPLPGETSTAETIGAKTPVPTSENGSVIVGSDVILQGEVPTEPAPRSLTSFNDNFKDPTSGWGTYNGQLANAEYLNGNYHVSIENRQLYYIARPYIDMTDTDIRVKAYKTSGADDVLIGIVCRYQSPEKFYAMVIEPDGYFAILKRSEGYFYLLGIDKIGYSEYVHGGSTQNDIEGVCQGTNLSLYANNQILMKVDDSEYQTGEIGLLVLTGDQPGTDILFSDFTAKVP